MDTVQHNPLERAVAVLGSQAKLAAAIGGKVKQAHVWLWLRKMGGRLPAEHCVAVEAATAARGEVVTRYELRPDVFGAAPANYRPAQVPSDRQQQAAASFRRPQMG